MLRLICCAVLSGTLVSAADTAWKVGLGRADITPNEPIILAGYAARTPPSNGVDSKLWAKAIAIEDSRGRASLLVTTDIIGYTTSLADTIAVRLEASRGLQRADLLLNASHTHGGPMVDLRRLHEATNDKHLQDVNRRYVEFFVNSVVQAAEQALDNRKAASLSWGTGEARFVFNRRQFTPNGIIIGVNPRGPADRTVPVLRVADMNGETRAVVFGAAAHCVTQRGDNTHVTGDYAGFAQWRIETELGAQAMFVNGCSGDAVPHPRGGLTGARRHGDDLGNEVIRVLTGDLTPIEGQLETRLEFLDLPLQDLSRDQIEKLQRESANYHGYFADLALRRLDEGKTLPRSYKAPFALWSFGDDLTLVAFSGETVVDFALLAEKALGPLGLWLSGYNNDVFGYLPSARVLGEGGYETRGLIGDEPGLFAPEAEQAIIDTIKRMAESTGRSLP